MNDPHVVALIYKVHHTESVDYAKAEPLAFEEDDFRVEVKDREARFRMKKHYSTGQEARYAVEPFIRNWVFDAAMGHFPGYFELEFDRPEIVDRKPTPCVQELRFDVVSESELSATFTQSPSRYPCPPSGIDANHADVRTLFERYKGFVDGNEKLASFAYFCLTVLEQSLGQGTTAGPRRPSRRRERTAERYRIDVEVLQRIGELSSTKGGSDARKAAGAYQPFSDEERLFLEAALPRLIHRVADHHGGNNELSPISIGDFSPQES